MLTVGEQQRRVEQAWERYKETHAKLQLQPGQSVTGRVYSATLDFVVVDEEVLPSHVSLLRQLADVKLGAEVRVTCLDRDVRPISYSVVVLDE